MRVSFDMDPRDVWEIQERAEKLGVTPGEVMRMDRARLRPVQDLPLAVRGRVLAGLCDADIAAELNETNACVATVRRSLGLPANRNPHRSGGGRRKEAA